MSHCESEDNMSHCESEDNMSQRESEANISASDLWPQLYKNFANIFIEEDSQLLIVNVQSCFLCWPVDTSCPSVGQSVSYNKLKSD